MELFKPRFDNPKGLTNWGDEKVFKREEWVDPATIYGDDMTIFNAPIMTYGFNRIMNLHEPRHSVAFVSLCTKTRPYYNSRKWATFIKEFGGHAEFIVASNAGIIPFEFWDSYPYTVYEGEHKKEHDITYVATFFNRFQVFFERQKYQKIIFNFRPPLRDRISAQNFKDRNPDKNVVILPTEETYNQIKSEGFPAGKMFPDLDPRVLKEIKDELGVVDEPKGFGF